MKHALIAIRWITALCFTVAISGCMKDHITRTYTLYTPVYKTEAEVLANIKANAPRTIKEKGKIFLYGNYIFLNEVDKGVHIINNSNPAAPVREAFIDIPGNIDIAVKGNTLFADFYDDLLALDISNPLQVQVKKIVRDVFPDRRYSNGFTPNPTMVIVDWIVKDTTVRVDNGGIPGYCISCNSTGFALSSDAARTSASVTGIAGSMSRFSIVNDYLYAVNSFSLNVLNITNPADPTQLGTSNIGSSIETIYPFKDKLFIGSSSGMFIYSIANPAAPVRQGQFMHARACDPVVADEDYAYVTLRSGTACQGFTNQLDVVNVQNVLAPSLTKTYPMTNPHGLSKDGNLLFLCDGRDGLKVYDATNVSDLKQLSHIKDLETYDAIAWNNNLIVVASEGLYQYSYTTGSDLTLLSKITIDK